jgi:hypothetical protein
MYGLERGYMEATTEWDTLSFVWRCIFTWVQSERKTDCKFPGALSKAIENIQPQIGINV